MENNEFNQTQSASALDAQAVLEEKPRENVLLGTLGAFLFSLVGGAVYFILYQFGYLAALSGIVAVVCAMYGYKLFAKGESRKGVVIAVVMSFVALILAWYCCLAKDIYDAYAQWYQSGEIDYTVSYLTAFRNAYIFLDDSEVSTAYFADLAVSLFLAVVGCIGMFVRKSADIKRSKKTKAKKEEVSIYDEK